MTTYSVMEGDTVRVCAAVLCGSLLQETIVTLSTVNGTAKGHCMNRYCMDDTFILYVILLVSL